MSDQTTPPPAAPAPQGADPAQPAGTVPPAQPAASPVVVEPPKEKKSGGVLKRIVMYVVIGAVFVVGGYIYREVTGDPQSADVGDCMVGQDANSLKVIECTDGTAEWKVVGKLTGKTEAAADSQDICAEFPTTEVSFWEGKRGGTGYVLCLEPVK